MALALRASALLVLSVCGWMGADGLLDRVYLPWDADRLPERASDARLLALRPVSPFARFRDALSRADRGNSFISGLTRNETVPGGGFGIAARGVLKWGRNQPGTLLDLGRVALKRGLERHDAADREIGEALLVEYTRRTTHAENEGIRTWSEIAEKTSDPFPVWKAAPAALWPSVGAELTASRPDAAWRFFMPALEDGTLDPRYVPYILVLARNRRQPGDVRILKALVNRADLTPEATRDLRVLIAELQAIR